jgi:hypothetical protein
MLKHALIPATLAFAIAVAGCGSQADAGSAGGDVSQYTGGQKNSGSDAQPSADDGATPSAVSAIDPCTLLTREEIVGQIEASMERNQREAFLALGGKWDLTSTPLTAGIARECEYTWRGTIGNGDVRSTSSFKVAVTDGAFVNGDVNKAKDRPIPGVGDEAYFMSHGSMMPYARVGRIGVGIEGFPDTPTARGGTDLLRAAVARLRAR